jgi:HAD superfamily hydrolase (TIGR01450 family)
MPAGRKKQSYEVHSSFEEIADRYDGFILDQFGVMHDGSMGLDGAPECISALAAQGKKMVILSNTSAGSDATMAKLPKLGFDQKSIAGGAVTSGEEASEYLSSHKGGKMMWITWMTKAKVPPPLDFVRRCGSQWTLTTNADEADILVVQGSEVLRGPGPDGQAEEISLGSFSQTGDMSIIDSILKKCKARNIPMVCANPDFIVILPDGNTGHMPGKMAKSYEEMGGECTYFGKPHKAHFEACIRQLGLPRDKVAHVGDSLHHDVAGANASNIDSVFVTGGVHREDLGTDLGSVPDRTSLDELFAAEGQTPTHVVPLLKMN